MVLLIGPVVAVCGVVAIIFVFRHKSVEKRSLYSSKRSQLEHKVRAARQRTLAPQRRTEAKAAAKEADEQALTAAVAAAPEPTVVSPFGAAPEPTVVSPPGKPLPKKRFWDRSPTAPEPAEPASTPPAEPAYTPPAEPAYTPPPPQPAYTPPPPEPAYTPPPAAAEEPAWTPGPAPAEPAVPAATAAGGPSWSIVESDQAEAEPGEKDKKKKKEEEPAHGAAWSLASGESPTDADQDDTGPRRSSGVVAIAQYAVFAVGLIMVLIGVLVMVANSQVA